MTGINLGIKDIAETAGVSIATVSRYLSGTTIRPAYRTRVEAALARLDYRPNLGARRLRSGDAGLIGLVVPDIGNPFFVAMIRAMEAMAWRGGRRIILCNSDEDPDREARLLTMLEDERVSGIIIAPAIGSTAPETTVPTVLVDRGLAGSRHDVVSLDNPAAAASLIDALHVEGCRHILGIFGQWGPTANERRRGFVEQIAAHNLRLSTIAVPHDLAQRRTLVRRAIDATDVDAVVCGDSVILLDAAIVIGEASRHDVRLAGFDSAEWLQLVRNEPIVLAQPVEEMAHAALALLTSRMAGDQGDPVTVTFGGRIVAKDETLSADQDRNR